MFKKLFTISILVLLQNFSNEVKAQFIPSPSKPAICNTAAAGYFIGGKLEFQPQFGCTSLSGTKAPVTIKSVADPNTGNLIMDNPVLYTNVDNNFNINTATGAIPMTASGTLNLNLDPGNYWMMVSGDKGGKKYYACYKFEAMSAVAPKVVTSSCSGNTIELSIPKDTLNRFDKYEITWEAGNKEIFTVAPGQTFPIKKTKTYATLPPLIQVRANYIRTGFGDICMSGYSDIKPNGGKAPFINYLEGENYGSEATVKFIEYDNNTSYDLLAKIDDANSNNPFTKLTVGKNGAIKVTGLDPKQKYCFKLSVTGSCGSPIESQNTVCSIVVKSNLKSTKEVDLSWNLPLLPNAIPTDLKLREVVIPGGTPNSLTLPSKSATAKSINTLDCSKLYEYYVSAVFPQVLVVGASQPWSVQVISAPHKVDPKSNAKSLKPSSIAQVDYDPMDDSKINLTIFESGTSSNFKNKYTFFRAENDSPNFVKLGDANTSSFTDVALTVGVAKSYCYKYQKQDECGITSELSDPFCTILLTTKKTNTLNWTPYLIPPTLVMSSQPVEYTITWYDEDLSAFTPDITTNNLSATIGEILKKVDKDKVKFKIQARQFVIADAIPSGQYIGSSSNVVEIPNPAKFYVPNIFTPNGTGPSESETFIVKTKFISSGKIKVFDRWGGAIFEGDLSQGWDGMEGTKNTPAPAGTYPYVVNAISNEGKEINMKGTVLLLR
jgi:gliding motility-associated-like protein